MDARDSDLTRRINTKRFTTAWNKKSVLYFCKKVIPQKFWKRLHEIYSTPPLWNKKNNKNHVESYSTFVLGISLRHHLPPPYISHISQHSITWYTSSSQESHNEKKDNFPLPTILSKKRKAEEQASTEHKLSKKKPAAKKTMIAQAPPSGTTKENWIGSP
jgi:hypothetical protein